MRINYAFGDMKTRLRYTHHTNPSIVVWNILQQPIDTVVSVSTLVNVTWTMFFRIEWTNLFKHAFRHIATSSILVDKNKSFLLKMIRRPECRSIIVYSVRCDAVWRTRQ